VLHDDSQAVCMYMYVGRKLDISNISQSLRVSNNLSEACLSAYYNEVVLHWFDVPGPVYCLQHRPIDVAIAYSWMMELYHFEIIF